MTAISKFRTQEAYDILKSRVSYGEEIEWSRPTAIRAFADVAGWLWDTNRREAEEMLIDVLKDDDWGSFFPPAKSSAMSGEENRLFRLMFAGLAVLKGPKTVPALEKLKAVVAEQMHPRIDRFIESVEPGASAVSKVRIGDGIIQCIDIN